MSQLKGPTSGSDGSPEQFVLRMFAPEAQARVVGVRHETEAHAVVQVGFPGKEAFFWIRIFGNGGLWSLNEAPSDDP